MANIGEIRVPIRFELVEDSPALRDILRQLIREELAKPETTNQVTKNIAKSIRMNIGKR